MICYPAEEIRFDVEILGVPHFFSECRGSYPYLCVMSVLVINLAPQTHLSAKHVVFVRIRRCHFANILIVQIHPSDIAAIAHSIVVSHSHIKVERSILRNNNLFFSVRQSPSPPMNNISLLDLNVIGVHPIHRFFI
jgi:hypothetical protein